MRKLFLRSCSLWLGLGLLGASQPTDAIDNVFYELSDDAAPIEPPPGWTASGDGSRFGITIISTGNTRTYTRSDLDITAGQAWQIEAVLSAGGLGGAGERGARMWARFSDPDLPPLPPGPKYVNVQLGLMEDAIGQRRVALIDAVDGSEKTSLYVDWASNAPRLRLRLKRQRTAGGDYIVIQAEPSRSGPLPSDPLLWDDPADRNPDPDTVTSRKVPIQAFKAALGGATEFGFGNAAPGADYASTWESIHVTRASDATTQLPYWPETPPAPSLHATASATPGLQDVALDVDLGPSGSYLANDVAYLALESAAGLDVRSVPDPSNTSGGMLHEEFEAIPRGQVVTGTVAVREVSGRLTPGPPAFLGVAVPSLGRWELLLLGLLLASAAAIALDARGTRLSRTRGAPSGSR